MSLKLPIWDQRMLELMDNVMNDDLYKINNQGDFLIAIGINAQSTLKQIKEGKQSFRLQHFKAAGDKFNISMDWFFGYRDFSTRDEDKMNALALLKEATRLIEHELSQRSGVNKIVNSFPKKATKTKKLKK